MTEILVIVGITQPNPIISFKVGGDILTERLEM